MLLSNFDLYLDEGGVDAFAPLGLPKAEDQHLAADDVMKLFENGHAEADGLTSSSSDGSGSSGRASEATPLNCSAATQPSNREAASRNSWMHLAPQMTHSSAPASATMVYPQHQQQYQWQSPWHSAFSADGASQQTSKESKGTVSHSTIEKQRRDRINSLIDELRELVPPSAAMRGPDGGDAKRPKHVVLSDTINLLRQLKEKVQHDECERQRLHLLQQHMGPAPGVPEAPVPASTGHAPPHDCAYAPVSLSMPFSTQCGLTSAPLGHSPQSLLQHSLSGSLTSQTVPAAHAASLVTANSCPELPQAPVNLPSAVGVLVEEGEGSFLVKVNCRDRHGLLSDITQALSGLPLQISRAAITTGNGGAVYDVFEIVAEPSSNQEPVTALDVQFYVHQALHKWKTAQAAASNSLAAGKRQRM